MSRMSQLHAELSEQAAELGFESISEAEQAGYGVDWQNAKLIEPEEAAHQEWLAYKKMVLADLKLLHERLVDDERTHDAAIVGQTIKFIEGGEM